MQKNISQICKASRVGNAEAAGTSPVTTSSVDMKGFLSCTFVVSLGTNGAGNSVTVEHSSNDSDWNATGFVANLDASANAVGLVEVDQPLKRYVRAVVTRASSASVDSVVALQSRGATDPAAQPSGVTSSYALAPADA